MKQGMGLDLLAVPEMRAEMAQLKEASEYTDGIAEATVTAVRDEIRNRIDNGDPILTENIRRRLTNFDQIFEAWVFNTVDEHGPALYQAMKAGGSFLEVRRMIKKCASIVPPSIKPLVGEHQSRYVGPEEIEEDGASLTIEQIRLNLRAQCWKHILENKAEPEKQQFQRSAVRYKQLRELEFRELVSADLPQIKNIYEQTVIRDREIALISRAMYQKYDRVLQREAAIKKEELSARGLFVEEWGVPYGEEPPVSEDFRRGLENPQLPTGENFLGFCLSNPTTGKIYAIMTAGMRGSHDVNGTFRNTMHDFVQKGSLGGTMRFQHALHSELLTREDVLNGMIRATYLAVDQTDPIRTFAAARLVAKTMRKIFELLGGDPSAQNILTFETLNDIELLPNRELMGIENRAATRLMTDYGATRYGTHRNRKIPSSIRTIENQDYQLFPIYDMKGGLIVEILRKAEANWAAIQAAFGDFSFDNDYKLAI